MGKPRAATGRDRTLEERRQTLVSRRQQLLTSVRRERRDLNHQSVDVSSEPLGEMGDRRSLNAEAEVAYELMGSRSHLLRQIERSLEKLDRGTYGLCEDCNEPIASRRLSALPFAIRCTACQESVERGGMTPSGSSPRR